MEYLTSDQIRKLFLEFFEKKGHKILPSASLVPDDPQLMFTVAGMVPFKPIFWGKVAPVYTRISTSQKCIRTTDIENVGRTPRHHTFFEMLGNFSFGDYFKKEAIEWAWEFLTEVLKFPSEKLWVSVYLEDDEAYNYWKEIGVPEYKIVRMGKEDNFWGPAGPTGPCGPCSEIYYDTGIEVSLPNGEIPTPANSSGKFIEIWNLVFTEFYQDEEGNLNPLPRKNIDTGAGLERIAAMMQGVYWNFDTDLFQPIIKKVEEVLGVEYKKDSKSDVSIRVISDHIRAVTFLISDGVLPSNEGRGYVLRRILRRALRHGTLLGAKEPFLYKIVDSVVKKMGHVYPEIVEKQSFVENIIKNEELRFLSNLSKGLEMVNKIIAEKGTITAEDSFRLYDTYGFPIDILRDIAEENGSTIDEEGFEKLLLEQRERSRKAQGEVEFAEKTGYEQLGIESTFVGYDTLEATATVLKIKSGSNFVDETKDCECEIVLDTTPFYAEKGGQVADKGVIKGRDFVFEVTNVYSPVENVIVHKGKLNGKIRINDEVIAQVDRELREATMRNHTATHLLHTALRIVLGDHVRQAGSLVEPTRLRFDFTHYNALTKEEIEKIENIVNEVVLKALNVVTEVKAYDEAVKEGAVALFDEKYGNFVRVVKIGDFSEELCGGTHVKNTGNIGLFKIISETAISAGVRRIEATTGIHLLNYLRKLEENTKNLQKVLEVPPEKFIDKILKLENEIKSLKKELENAKKGKVDIESLKKNVRDFNGTKYLAESFDGIEINILKDLSDDISASTNSIVLLLTKGDGKVSFVVKVPKELSTRYNAGSIAKEIAKVLGGGGGGSPTFAQAGGKSPEKVPEALELFEKLIRKEV